MAAANLSMHSVHTHTAVSLHAHSVSLTHTVDTLSCTALHARRSFTYEEFISAQAKVQRRVADELAVRNEELAAAIEDVVQLVQVRA